MPKGRHVPHVPKCFVNDSATTIWCSNGWNQQQSRSVCVELWHRESSRCTIANNCSQSGSPNQVRLLGLRASYLSWNYFGPGPGKGGKLGFRARGFWVLIIMIVAFGCTSGQYIGKARGKSSGERLVDFALIIINLKGLVMAGTGL